MMDWTYVIIGGLVVLAVVVDIAWSTLALSGGGPITNAVSRAVWWTMRGVRRITGSRKVLLAAAPAILLGVVFTWAALLWTGWAVIYLAAPDAVVDATTSAPAVVLDRFYFIGFTMFTLGTGDYVGGTPGWRFLSSVVSFSGLFAVTLAITYIIPIVRAGVEKRRLALAIHSLGSSAGEIVANGWDGDRFEGLALQLKDLTPQLLLHAERHLVFPVVHYLVALDERASLPENLLSLHDAVQILGEGVEEAHRPDPSILGGTEFAIDFLLERAGPVDEGEPESTRTPTLDVHRLEAAGVPITPAFESPRPLGREPRRRRICQWAAIAA